MDSSRKTTPVSQRGIGAFLTGLNAAKYSDSKLPSRGRPPKKQKVHFETITEDGPSTADDEEVGIQSAMLQPQLMAADNEVTPLPLSRNVTLKHAVCVWVPPCSHSGSFAKDIYLLGCIDFGIRACAVDKHSVMNHWQRIYVFCWPQSYLTILLI